MPAGSPTLILATRRSALARRQAELARAALAVPSAPWQMIELLPLTTTGDRQRDWSLPEHGGKGLFTRELEDALRDGRARLAVHSAKDLPTTLPEGLVLAGFLPRSDPRDVLVRRTGVDAPRTIATGSPRRRAQAQAWWPHATWRELRGNVESRLKKIAGGEADATFLAAAGLERLGLIQMDGLVFETLPVERMVPAAGQGAIALECRAEDESTFAPLLCAKTHRAVSLERAVLAMLGGGCQNASAAHFADDKLFVFHDGRKECFTSVSAANFTEAMVAKVAAWLGPLKNP
jgi:hydroxymethylbilane synthase